MKARIKNPVFVIPEAMKALHALSAATESPGLSHKTVGLVQLRASQINGCGVCLDMHWRDLKKAGETDERIVGLSAWRDTPFYSDAERAALALTECVTRLSDRADPVPDDVWDEAARHHDEASLAALVISIAAINVWNRINVATRQIAGKM